MDSSVTGSVPILYTQQSQSAGIPSAASSEPDVSRSRETLLPPTDSFNSEQVPDDKKAADRTIHPQPEGEARPQLAEFDSLPSILDSLSNIATTLPAAISAHDPNIKPEDKPPAPQASQAGPLPEALEEMLPQELQPVRGRAAAIADFFRSCCGIRDRHASHPPPRSGT
ncbi:hypothetical protein [Endozoicomonas sp. GU-1]|uniref:hypothetical protein n=1 Tax=Endozoicomonas sp. GU-1 TaxID=3009078 RepID=UPI0022B3C63C|nr:hypothetical protein [Endozoicomonas sp. GU-1]WBA81878.1 hypothetical protein O2T12_01515 [Endozoicomonas sp. GU-1]WBA84832.1 hypothetical protein O3276_16310 [Endozoicomonas sp. GU-1]